MSHSCTDLNEFGYCKECGKAFDFPSTSPTLDQLGKWPENTWFQRRRAEVRYAEVSKVQS